MPKQGYSSITVDDETIDIVYDLSQVTDWSMSEVVKRSVKYYKKMKIKELKKYAEALG